MLAGAAKQFVMWDVPPKGIRELQIAPYPMFFEVLEGVSGGGEGRSKNSSMYLIGGLRPGTFD